MKIIHILIEGPDSDAEVLIAEYDKDQDTEVVDLSLGEISYDELVDKIEQCDKVISW